MYRLTDHVMEVFVWAVFALYAIVRLWPAYARRNARDIDLQTPDTMKRRQPWLTWCFGVIGLGLNWRLAFESFGGRNSLYSTSVLSKTGLIVVWVTAIAVLAVVVTRAARWRDLAAFFLLFSFAAYGWFSVDWIVHPR